MTTPPDESDDFGLLRQQIGEILGTARSLHEQMREQKEEARRQEDRLSIELRSTKEEHRATNQIISVRIEQLTIQIRDLDERAKAITSELSGVKDDVSRSRYEIAEIKAPVAGLITLRNKIMGYTMITITATTILWYIIGPGLRGLMALAIDSFMKSH